MRPMVISPNFERLNRDLCKGIDHMLDIIQQPKNYCSATACGQMASKELRNQKLASWLGAFLNFNARQLASLSEQIGAADAYEIHDEELVSFLRRFTQVNGLEFDSDTIWQKIVELEIEAECEITLNTYLSTSKGRLNRPGIAGGYFV
jgi:hypothetical protein